GRISLDDAHEDAAWFGLLHAGDVLTPDALFEMVYYQNRHPQCDLIHSVGWHALSLRRACPAPPRPSKTQGVPPTEVGSLARASGWYANEEALLHRLSQATDQIGHVQKILCRRARPGPHPTSPPQEQPVVLTHAPCPRIDLETVRSILIVKLDQN